MNKPYKILFICTGNICRSPTAQGVAEFHLREANLDGYVQVDSAATHDYHIGSHPDHRAIATAKNQNIDISKQRARKITPDDFANFDELLVMDHSHLQTLQKILPSDARNKLKLVMEYAPNYGLEEVPDPYYGDQQGFDQVLEMLDQAMQNMAHQLRARLA